MALSNNEIIADLRKSLGAEQVLARRVEIQAYAGDASIYRLVPIVVVRPRDFADLNAILDYCRENKLYLTFRAAGTSLSGQAVTDGIMVDVAHHWKGIRILEEGRQVAVEPGVVGSHVNAFLKRYKAKMGPDPASIDACMMGGIAANNASGLCCGTKFNTYNTMAAIKLLLADGFYLDTAQGDPDLSLQRERPQIYEELVRIREIIATTPGLKDRIRSKYAIKNTCGYSMNAFVDYENPADILAHLIVGSEGTLGFIGEITLNTLPDKPLKATALVYFSDLPDAGLAIHQLAHAGAAVLEIMDRKSMLSVAQDMNYGFEPTGNCAALLVEFQEESEAELEARMAEAMKILSRHLLIARVEFTRDPKLQAHYWNMRKGLFPSVGAMRKMGTAVLIEDVAVPPARLAECIVDLQDLLNKYAFHDAIIFGHAKEGNLHFVLCNDFSNPRHVSRYEALMEELTSLIVSKYDGSLKAEHGTGRNIAPFVEREWGTEIYQLMWRVKKLLDPLNILNPGIVLNLDPKVHLQNLKMMPLVSPIVDKCIECGFCEPKCPSRDLTVTPRQRIALLREVARLEALGDGVSRREAQEIMEGYRYDGIETCAGDGMCAVGCPVDIDTGAMIKNLRAERHGAMAKWVAKRVAANFKAATAGARLGIRFLRATGAPGMAVARVASNVAYKLSDATIPRIDGSILLPKPAPPLPKPQSRGGNARKIVYYPSCLTRSLGSLDDERASVGLAQAVVTVLEKLGYEVIIPPKVEETCCGQPFYSKGLFDACTDSLSATVSLLFKASEEGKYPIISDTSPCTGELRGGGKLLTDERLRQWKALRIFDFVEFMAKEIVPLRASWPKASRHAIIHPTCTLKKLGALDDLKTVVAAFANSASYPVHDECCGFAGDRGYNVPELTLSATKQESAEVLRLATESMRTEAGSQKVGYYSTCRTCEIGMTAGTGKTYQSVVYLCYDALVK